MRSLRWAGTAVAVLASALSWTGSAAPASAQSPPAQSGEFTLRPVRPPNAPARDRSYVVRTVRAGTELADRLEAVNLTDAPLELTLTPVDATILADGSFAPGTTAAGDGSWLTVSPTRVRVPARGASPVELRIKVPDDARHGDHIAAVVAQRADGATSPGPGNVRLVQRVGVRTYLTVEPRPGEPADRRAFEFRDLRFVGGPEGRLFEADIANVGDLLIEPLGTLSITRGGLGADTELPVLGTVPPGESRSLKLSAPQRLEPGTYQAVVRLRDINGGPEQQRSLSFTVGADNTVVTTTPPDAEDDDGSGLPWWLPLLALLALLLAALAAWLLRRRREGEPAEPVVADPQP